MIATVIHVAFCFGWLIKYDLFDRLELWSFSMTVLTGCLLLAAFAIMFVTALPWFRKKKSNWRMFYVIHVIGTVFFYILLLLHGMRTKRPSTYVWVIPSLIIYSFDRLVRHFMISRKTLYLDGEHSTLKEGNVLELRIKKAFNYRAGQYAEIAVPSLSTKEWHPFTMASAPHESTMVFYIKSGGGDWCAKLYEAFERREKDMDMDPLHVKIRGPYGAPAQHTGSYRHVVLISGGIGSTPFAAVAKDIHYRGSTNIPLHACAEKTADERATSFDDRQLPNMVRTTIDYMYGCRKTSSVTEESHEVEDDDAQSIADSLKLESFSAEGECDMAAAHPAAPSYSKIDPERNIIIPRKIERFLENSPRKRFLSILHSTRVTMALILSIVIRFALVCIIAIWRQAEFGWSRTILQSPGYWAVLVDAILGLILATVMSCTIILEISFMKARYFSRSGRALDFFAFLPLTILSAVVSIATYGSPTVKGALTIQHFAVLLLLQFILLANRMYRSLGSRTILANGNSHCGCRCLEKVPNADFIWVSRTAKEDEWLREELKPLGDGSTLRLHRFLTRQNSDEINIDDSEGHISTHTGRPDWKRLLSEIADRASTGAEVGVFFCGPKTMGSDLKKAIKHVEVKSSLRGSYLAGLSDKEIKRNYLVDSDEDITKLRNYGNFIRLVFREEKF